MLTDRHVDAYVAQRVLPPQPARRLANGSLDYAVYDRRARKIRALAISTALRVFALRLRRLNRRTAGAAAVPQLTDWELRLAEPTDARPATPRKDHRQAA